MKQFFLALAWCILMVGIGTCVNLNAGCAGKRLTTWERCGTYSNQECRGLESLQDELDCEYKYYKECIEDE